MQDEETTQYKISNSTVLWQCC